MTWSEAWPPVAITVFAWWFSTGLILLLVRLPRHWHKGLLAACAMPAGLSIWGLIASADNQTPAGIYCGFVCTLVIWGWHEASFLMGKITGPRPKPCPEGVKGWTRFGYATATLLYHEVALFVTLLVLIALTWTAPNQMSALVFGLLFVLRLSAKFNIFFGVPNLTDEFFPPHLEHLKSYLPKRSMNMLMPVSLFACIAFIVVLSRALVTTETPTGLLILITLTALGMLEHLFMITPLPDATLWRWAVPAKKARSSEQQAPPLGDATKPENV
jgi:putative photosynthetic complex assembly protein 2